MAEIRQLLKELNDLLNEWDPINVVEDLKEEGLPLDEYSSYAPGILGLLQKNADEDAIADELARIITDRMELKATRETESFRARKICEWYRSKVSP